LAVLKARPSWSIRILLAALLTGAVLGPFGVAATEQAPPLVRRAIALYEADHRGDLGFSRHLSFKLHVGPMVHDVRNEVGILMRDGAYVKVRYYSSETNGRPDGSSEMQRQEDKANADIAAGHGFFKRPVDARYSDDYRFENASCDGCAVGESAFAFTTTVHDRWHGHGTVVIDNATARVVRIAYTYEKPPDHATSADAVETFGEGMQGLWTCTHVEENYHGRMGLIGGTATMTYTLDHFKRFAQLESGLTALSQHAL